MNSFRLAKYNIKSSLKSIMTFYCIIMTLVTYAAIANNFFGEETRLSGIEVSSMIFLFVLGLNSFKENFYFSQANNISRINYFKSLVITILSIALSMSIIDVIINKVCNIFAVCPTIYDMIYGDFPQNYVNTRVSAWTQSSSVQILIGTVAFLFAVYIAAFVIGLLITMIIYKCNKIMKILVSLSPFTIYLILEIALDNSPKFRERAGFFVQNMFGLSTKNSYMAVITFVCLSIISICLVYMLIRKVVVKRR
ncbi:hypothetical protein [Clostridium estertheticum]|uniref:hypothetical protein n=1 Tax=Clostridium estertheticum TaxID=238834 RepID=UPI001CF24F5F|nr:hypothetical protein [Clostridium estertheticum]MCB2357460.1 hypothetical protein [Clostridium estertheticum]